MTNKPEIQHSEMAQSLDGLAGKTVRRVESMQVDVNELKALRQRVKEQDDFIHQLADHMQEVEAELIRWQNGELRVKSKSPYLSGELAGNTYPGLGYVPEQGETAAPKPKEETPMGELYGCCADKEETK